MKNITAKNNYRVHIQRATRASSAPDTASLRAWAMATLQASVEKGEITIRIVAPKEMQYLNLTYRKKDYATNVLSFRDTDDENGDLPTLGDLVICASVVKREAEEQHKALKDHWAHMIVHGILHLLGHDHENEQDANIMEAKEIELLQQLHIANPYDKD